MSNAESGVRVFLKKKVENLLYSFDWSNCRFCFDYGDFSIEFYQAGEHYLGVCIETLRLVGKDRRNVRKAEGPFWSDDTRLSWLKKFEEELNKRLGTKHYKVGVYFHPRLIEPGNI